MIDLRIEKLEEQMAVDEETELDWADPLEELTVTKAERDQLKEQLSKLQSSAATSAAPLAPEANEII